MKKATSVVFCGLMSLVLAIAGCGGGDKEKCDDGTTQCSGNVIQTCTNDQWVDGTDCAASGKTCQNGACVGGTCTTGQTQCSGNVIQTCAGGQWVDGTDCAASGKTCQNGACVGGGNTMPKAGVWSYSQFQYGTNTCKLEALGTGQGGFGISNVADPTFHVIPGDNSQEFDCTVSGSSYTCHRGEVTQTVPNYDVTLHGAVDVSGTFTDTEHTSGTQNGTVTCTGTQCTAAAAYLQISFPCSVVVNYSGNWEHQ